MLRVEREEASLLRAKMQMDDPYLGGERQGQCSKGIREQDLHRCWRLLEGGWPSNSRQDHIRECLQLRGDR
ncbi:hypothetical protein [Synechococcus sp. UW140]|uniref:hypothetical protein n=1 Tax=Synechococcus sp. UW140 TaxID=368503 RepID=UPI003137904F